MQAAAARAVLCAKCTRSPGLSPHPVHVYSQLHRCSAASARCESALSVAIDIFTCVLLHCRVLLLSRFATCLVQKHPDWPKSVPSLRFLPSSAPLGVVSIAFSYTVLRSAALCCAVLRTSAACIPPASTHVPRSDAEPCARASASPAGHCTANGASARAPHRPVGPAHAHRSVVPAGSSLCRSWRLPPSAARRRAARAARPAWTPPPRPRPPPTTRPRRRRPRARARRSARRRCRPRRALRPTRRWSTSVRPPLLSCALCPLYCRHARQCMCQRHLCDAASHVL